ncbi:hypothetical protein Y032_0005g2342 [Ancylostoma ceylanicum]|uniref:Uncharacterized protein n=1 Tax=Ancylostoma ceylanicum TaxID=53326 RepID=A0A016VRI6_9BILA|nr:hypothetical protein Y032_0005g2342 [Ancylostoma ceylanicum]
MPFLLHEHRPRCITSQKIVGGDELFKKTVSDVANSVITEFVSSVGDPSTYSKDVAKQFYADTDRQTPPLTLLVFNLLSGLLPRKCSGQKTNPPCIHHYAENRTRTIAYEQALDDVRTDSWNC